ncbi:hypothetical protein IFM89_014880 [Coptis chinensis]|uniref:Uncharacterized protein n=1 Tax=Coptis chinensis TaxID=261450 RepID=A0A835HDC5_9MAGN|nr:hypothetical protein IFM89_014880 [Coptis chinensis]
MRISNIYGLVPGEDSLFANRGSSSSLDAFKSGDKHTRLCILKPFLFRDKASIFEIRHMVLSSLGSCHVLEVLLLSHARGLWLLE